MTGKDLDSLKPNKKSSELCVHGIKAESNQQIPLNTNSLYNAVFDIAGAAEEYRSPFFLSRNLESNW